MRQFPLIMTRLKCNTVKWHAKENVNKLFADRQITAIITEIAGDPASKNGVKPLVNNR